MASPASVDNWITGPRGAEKGMEDGAERIPAEGPLGVGSSCDGGGLDGGPRPRESDGRLPLPPAGFT